jgi:hypothetical protein
VDGFNYRAQRAIFDPRVHNIWLRSHATARGHALPASELWFTVVS